MMHSNRINLVNRLQNCMNFSRKIKPKIAKISSVKNKEKDNINFEDANFVKLGEKSDLKDNEYFKLLNDIIEHKNKSKINDEMENEDKQSMHK